MVITVTGLGHCARWFWRWSLKNDFWSSVETLGANCYNLAMDWEQIQLWGPLTTFSYTVYSGDLASESAKFLLLLLYNSCRLLLRINRWNGTFCLNVSFIFLGWISAMAFPCSTVLSGKLFLSSAFLIFSLLFSANKKTPAKCKQTEKKASQNLTSFPSQHIERL